MKCYRCGATLTQHDFCTACKCDVRQYKLVMEAANRKYNEGLEKAQVRDLTGAMVCLKQCLKLNKEHIDARNLLGLIYYEIGEVVYALAEWIISKNTQPDKNIAGDYISRLQNNQSKLDTCNQAIRKYNRSLDLCLQGDDDLAIIQLKKVVSLNPNYIKAQLLLTLLYINKKEWDKAYAILKKVIRIDRGNTQAQSYLREVSRARNSKKGQKKAKEKDLAVRYERDNEVIIQPTQVVEPNTGKGTVAGFVIGFLLGAAILFFLVLPGRIESVRSELESTIRIANESKEAQSATIASLQNQVNAMLREKEMVISQYGDLYGEEHNEEAVNALIGALETYLNNSLDMQGISAYMDICVQNETFFTDNSNNILRLYNNLKTSTSAGLAQYHYNAGYKYYEEKKYTEAVTELELVTMYDSEHIDALYYMASSYQALENKEKAKEIYTGIVERFPNSARANQASRALKSLE